MMNTNALSWGHRKPASDLRCMVLLVLMSSGALCAAGESLTIRSEDLPFEAGTKRILAYSSGGGKDRGEVIEVVTENSKIGEASLVKIVQIVNGQRAATISCVVTPVKFQLFAEGDMKEAFMTQELPVKIGQSFRAGFGADVSVLHVERQERITVPAGTFDCLVQVMEAKGKVVQTVWSAPGAGIVQIKGDNMTAVLMAIQKPTSVSSEPNTKVLCNFDSGDPLSSPLFPKARWKPGHGTDKTNVICSVEIDPTQAALGTPMSMRWRYHIKGNPWIQTDFPLTGSSPEKVDVTIYDSISFYIKGFKRGGCLFMVHSQPVRQGDDGYVNIPVDYTTEWNKVTIDLRAPALSKLDLTKTTQISFGHLGQGDDANVVWIDEMTCHLKKAPAATADKAKTN
ncbi:MAG: hypothetical protein NTY01_19120 [Verrucomicrobia bacterium]|nr:hypothetical protein [Verrucomicrobiota bacterium]